MNDICPNFSLWKFQKICPYLTFKASNVKPKTWSPLLYNFEYTLLVKIFKKTCARFYRNQTVFEILNFFDQRQFWLPESLCKKQLSIFIHNHYQIKVTESEQVRWTFCNWYLTNRTNVIFKKYKMIQNDAKWCNSLEIPEFY